MRLYWTISLARGAQLPTPVSRIRDTESAGTTNRYQVFGIRDTESGITDTENGIRDTESGIRDRYQGYGKRYQVFGIRNRQDKKK